MAASTGRGGAARLSAQIAEYVPQDLCIGGHVLGVGGGAGGVDDEGPRGAAAGGGGRHQTKALVKISVPLAVGYSNPTYKLQDLTISFTSNSPLVRAQAHPCARRARARGPRADERWTPPLACAHTSARAARALFEARADGGDAGTGSGLSSWAKPFAGGGGRSDATFAIRIPPP